MYLQKLTLRNFRNYEESEFEFSDKINCLVGDNGAGKTNILEAIYYLSFSKCYTNPADYNNINHDSDYFQVNGDYIRNDSRENVNCCLKKNHRKVFKLNNKEYDRISDHIGFLPLVIISPYDRDLINEGSEVRRKYIDGVISQFDKSYLDNLLAYNRVLLQRNTLLKHQNEQGFLNSKAFEIWDEQLVRFGNFIHIKRKEFIIHFQELVSGYYKYLTNKSENIGLLHITQLDQSDFSELLKNSIGVDYGIRFTSCGIHKDDIDFLFNGHMIKKFGSQGQQKSFLIALKLAQYSYIRKIKGFNPILLLDDIFDKLDYERVQNLIRLVGDSGFGQVFITDTDQERVQYIKKHVSTDFRIIRIDQGKRIN